jgi:primosomal protein N' (replication factor Y)
MQTDMSGRKMANMPPYGQLIAVIIEGQREPTLHAYCNSLRDAIPNLKGAKIMGPITAQIYQIRNWYRMRFLVAGPRNANLQPIVAQWLESVKQPANIRVKIDVNPMNFM